MQASQINRTLDFMREAIREASKLWWAFFDWLAVVEWRRLYLTWFLAVVFFIMVNTPEPEILLISCSTPMTWSPDLMAMHRMARVR